MTSRTETPARPALSAFVGDAVTRGAVAGLAGGTVFILANMVFANAHGKPPVAPLLSVSTIFTGAAMPAMSPVLAITGLVLHVFLSMVYGAVFGAIVAPLTRSNGLLVVSGLVFGLVLFLVDFEVFGRTAFPWFTNPNGPNPVFELIVHPIAFGLVLVPFFLGRTGTLLRRRES